MTLFENICEIVCKGEGVKMDDLLANCRRVEYVYPRQLIMYLAVTLRIGSHAVIGRQFEKDHATVTHACKAIRDYYDTDKVKRDRIDKYLRKLTGVKRTLQMTEVVEKQIAPVRKEIADLQNKVVNLQLLVNNIDNFVKELKL